MVEVVTPSMVCPWPPSGVGKGNIAPRTIDHVACMPEQLLSKFARPPSLVPLVLGSVRWGRHTPFVHNPFEHGR